MKKNRIFEKISYNSLFGTEIAVILQAVYNRYILLGLTGFDSV